MHRSLLQEPRQEQSCKLPKSGTDNKEAVGSCANNYTLLGSSLTSFGLCLNSLPQTLHGLLVCVWDKERAKSDPTVNKHRPADDSDSVYVSSSLKEQRQRRSANKGKEILETDSISIQGETLCAPNLTSRQTSSLPVSIFCSIR